MFITLAIIFLVLIVIGTYLTLLLYKFDFKALHTAELDKKIVMWVPYAVLFLLVLYLGSGARLVLFAFIVVMALFEFHKVYRQQRENRVGLMRYLVIFLIAFAHLGLIRLLPVDTETVLLFVIIGTVLSDVGGFLVGGFFGTHYLPDRFNNHKSYEGVFGQILGAFIGVLVVASFVTHQGNIFIALPIGIGSAIGDLLNSQAKRLASIRNWSNNIPGHGGFLDRFCSLAVSSLLTFYFLLLFPLT